MNYISSFFGQGLSEFHQSYFDQLPELTRKVMKNKPLQDQQKLLDTFSKQSQERIELLCRILDQQPQTVLEKLFTKEIRLLNALIKVDTSYLEDVVQKPNYLADALEKKN